MKKVVIIGAGPAGLTAGYELVKNKNYKVTILEAENSIGGLAKTLSHASNKFDIGGHRFFSRSRKVNSWWLKILPMQGRPTYDYRKTEREVPLPDKGPNPNAQDEVMLKRQRISHILYQQKFFDYPLKLNFANIRNLGFKNAFIFGLSYMKALLKKLPETSLENFYINRFGRKIYEMFFEAYTEKVWGKKPSELSADWGAQRVKGLSIFSLIKNFFYSILRIRHSTETSLIKTFFYPKYGAGQMWEAVAQKFTASGGKILRNAKVSKFEIVDNQITKVGYKYNGELLFIDADIVISSMPLAELFTALPDVPEDIRKTAQNLPYRDFVTIAMQVKRLKFRNTSKIQTLNGSIPDCWIYVQDEGVKLGRIQIYNNWSPYMIKKPWKCVWLGLEYFCFYGDEYWQRNKQQWREVAVKDLLNAGIINSKRDVQTYCVKKIQKAYPAYYGSYEQLPQLREYLNGFTNLYCIGRNGQHRYNNMDHSMLTAFAAVDHITGKTEDRSKIWKINSDKIYHERKDN